MEVRPLEHLADVPTAQAGIQGLAGFCYRLGEAFGILHLPGKGDQDAQRIVLFRNIGADGLLPAHGFLTATDHHHRLGLPFQQRLHVFAVVLHYDLHLAGDVVGVQAHPLH